MDSTKHRFFAPCPRGLEQVLDQELQLHHARKNRPPREMTAQVSSSRLDYDRTHQTRRAVIAATANDG